VINTSDTTDTNEELEAELCFPIGCGQTGVIMVVVWWGWGLCYWAFCHSHSPRIDCFPSRRNTLLVHQLHNTLGERTHGPSTRYILPRTFPFELRINQARLIRYHNKTISKKLCANSVQLGGEAESSLLRLGRKFGIQVGPNPVHPLFPDFAGSIDRRLGEQIQLCDSLLA